MKKWSEGYSINSNKKDDNMKIYLMKRKGQLSEASAKKGKKKMNSLYLMFHFQHRRREYEFLNLYLYDKPKTNLEKEHNKETMRLADAIKAQKVLEAQTTSHGFISSTKGKISFLEYFKSVVDKKVESLGNHGNWLSTYKHLQIFCKGKDITLDNIDTGFLENFRDYLLTCATNKGNKHVKLSQNTAMSYLNKVKACLNEAFLKKLIKENPGARIKGIRSVESNRQFLTLEELQKLAATECELPLLKTAFLFSCLTGLRWSDLSALTWKKISFTEGEGYFLNFTQKKTKNLEVLPVSEQAIKLLGERSDDLNRKIFEGLKYSAWNNIKLREWVKTAGIDDKHITIHSGRHSYACLSLKMGIDIYTVSKMLGHRHLKTTEIYGKVIMRTKIDAANKIPDLFTTIDNSQ